MKILGIGTDIAQKSRIEKLWHNYNASFARRILTAYEQSQLAITANKIAYLAKRFTAKEAIAKALGTGFQGMVMLSEIEIYNDNLGKPEVRFLGKTKTFINSLNLSAIHLSIADEKEYAIAFAIITQI